MIISPQDTHSEMENEKHFMNGLSVLMNRANQDAIHLFNRNSF